VEHARQTGTRPASENAADRCQHRLLEPASAAIAEGQPFDLLGVRRGAQDRTTWWFIGRLSGDARLAPKEVGSGQDGRAPWDV
jgi:hypothetical protein